MHQLEEMKRQRNLTKAADLQYGLIPELDDLIRRWEERKEEEEEEKRENGGSGEVHALCLFLTR